MVCPKCNSTSFVSGQRCKRCGYEGAETRASGARKRKVGDFSTNLAFEFAQRERGRPAKRWKQELKQKLNEVREKKGKSRGAWAPAEKKPSVVSSVPARIPEIRRSSVDPQPISRPDFDIHENLRNFQASLQRAPSEKSDASPGGTVKKSPVQHKLPKFPHSTHPSATAARQRREAVVRSRLEAETEAQNWVVRKGILFTRTLSGLIDLLIVAGCTGLFLAISLRFGNIDVMAASFRPVLWSSALFFHFFYSLYFLRLTHRTVGMMLTGLKVVDEQAGEPLFHQLLLRSIFFLFSWTLGMLGLLWSLWDRRSRCMHDFLSRTAVVRC